MKECGRCSLCCKLLEVPGLTEARKWCKHCKPGKGGCVIYDDRPKACLGFDCFWRAESWPEWLRPDVSKVMFESLPGVETVIVSTDPSKAWAWKDKRILGVIQKLRSVGRPVVVKTVSDTVFYIPDGWTYEDVVKEIDTVIEWQNDSSFVHN